MSDKLFFDEVYRLKALLDAATADNGKLANDLLCAETKARILTHRINAATLTGAQIMAVMDATAAENKAIRAELQRIKAQSPINWQAQTVGGVPFEDVLPTLQSARDEIKRLEGELKSANAELQRRAKPIFIDYSAFHTQSQTVYGMTLDEVGGLKAERDQLKAELKETRLQN